MSEKKLVLLDDMGNDYTFTSLYCFEVNGEFYEVLEHPHEWMAVWPHDEGVPKDFDDLNERCAYIIDYRNPERRIEPKGTDEEYMLTLDEKVREIDGWKEETFVVRYDDKEGAKEIPLSQLKNK